MEAYGNKGAFIIPIVFVDGNILLLFKQGLKRTSITTYCDLDIQSRISISDNKNDTQRYLCQSPCQCHNFLPLAVTCEHAEQ